MITSAADVLTLVADMRTALPRLPIDQRKLASDALAELLLDLDLDSEPMEQGR